MAWVTNGIITGYMIHFHRLVAITIPTGQLSLVPEKNYSHITGYMIHFHLMNLIIAIPPGPPSQAPS